MSPDNSKIYIALSVIIFISVLKCIETYYHENIPHMNMKVDNIRLPFFMPHSRSSKFKPYRVFTLPQVKRYRRQIYRGLTFFPRNKFFPTLPYARLLTSRSIFAKYSFTSPRVPLQVHNFASYINITNIKKKKKKSSTTNRRKTYNSPAAENQLNNTNKDTIVTFTPAEETVFEKYIRSVDCLERRFYTISFNKLSANAPIEKRENGISFVQSGLFLHLALTALTETVERDAREEIEAITHFRGSEQEKADALRYVMSMLPDSDQDLKFRKSYRLMLTSNMTLTKSFQTLLVKELNMDITYYNGSKDSTSMAKTLNEMVLSDSQGALHDTFDDTDISPNTCCVFISMLYIRGRWRSDPTLLNELYPFYDNTDVQQTMRMIRINDIVKYADLTDWDAQAVEINYTTPGLRLVVVVPRGRSLRPAAERLGALGAAHVLARMRPRRLAVILPLYTLRMTLMLPNKLHEMGINKLMGDASGDDDSSLCEKFSLTQAVQRIMFWSEAGRHAYKDDGIEWDEKPEMELVVNRPYVFFVRWHNLTLMNGNFVL